MTRRGFLGTTAVVSAASPATGTLAIHGGTPVRTERFPSWPKFGAPEEKELLAVLRSGKWGRLGGGAVSRFEQQYAALTGSKHCLATANGTSALITSLAALGVGPGDEVIVPPYTFVATVNAVLLHHALPVFVDSDLETFQIDASKIEAAITDHTRAIIPVHLGGSAADLDAVLELARRRKIPVIEDACQAHLGEWRGRKVGSLGTTGCFSFQASKNLNSGEGGAILTNDDEVVERCYSYHNNGRGRRTASYDFSYRTTGANLRMTEFQGALLTAQMTRLEEQSRTREQNAAALTEMLSRIPGILPAKMYPGCTRNAYHLYMFRYSAEAFAGVPKRTFLKALTAEGIPCSGGYSPLNKEPFIKTTLQSHGYKTAHSPARLKRWVERNECPSNDRLCEEAVWFSQTTMLGPRRDMEQIAEAVAKIQKNASSLAKG
jgi:dTDP-4-amino-4,6-dideoxygalactose transaminase